MNFGTVGMIVSTIAIFTGASAASADEVEDALQFALEAYQAGDIKTAREEVDFAIQLLQQMKTAALADFLPAAMDGWKQQVSNDPSAGAFGGSAALATYHLEGNQSHQVSIQIMAGGQMVTTMATMFGNAAMLGTMGTVKRIARQKAVVTSDGDIQALIDNRIMVQIGGTAPVEDKEAYFSLINFRDLEDF
jgi:hypothetical protein